MNQRVDRSFTGRTAILAGGATLIGRAVAAAFMAADANVVVADIDEAGAGMVGAGNSSCFVRTDVTRDQDIDTCIATALAKFGNVDFLVNITTSYLDNGLQTDRADWLRALDVAVVGGAIFARKLAPHLISQRGAIVNFSSISAHRAQAGRFVYPTAKAAVSQLTRAQALEFAPHGVRVNAVTPGWTWSNVLMAMSQDDRERVDRVGSAFHMMGRVADAEEVARVVLFLCSDAASFITGAEVPVDGGYLALGPEQSGNAIAALLNSPASKSSQ